MASELADRDALNGAPEGPLFVHCDAQRTMRHAEGTTRQAILASHIRNLKTLAHGRNIWVPTFNYDYCQTGTYHVDTDPSQVGAITEYFRKDVAKWRSNCPVFSVAGTGQAVEHSASELFSLDPFGDASSFARLVSRDGTIVWYGAPFSSTTFIHHIERISGGPLYRYDKVFDGTVIYNGAMSNCHLRYHVRPQDHRLGYDWPRLRAELLSSDIIRSTRTDFVIAWCSARSLAEFWREKLLADPLHLLDAETRVWVEARLSRLGRRFELADFEQEKS